MAEDTVPTVWEIPQGTFQKSGIELLKSGLFADAQVKCGDRTWKVHKNIVCIRSKWFKKALMGHFEEGTTGTVTITGFSENEVDCLLHFLYSGAIDFNKAFPDMTTLVAVQTTWRLADFFCLDTLDALLTQAFEDAFGKLSKRLFSDASNDLGGAADVALREDVLPAIRTLYNDDAAAVRDKALPQMLGLVIAAIPNLHRREDFTSLLRDIPEFAADWTVAFVEGMDPSLPVLAQTHACSKCKKHVNKSDGVWDRFKWIKYRKEGLLCSRCFVPPTVADWKSAK